VINARLTMGLVKSSCGSRSYYNTGGSATGL